MQLSTYQQNAPWGAWYCLRASLPKSIEVRSTLHFTSKYLQGSPTVIPCSSTSFHPRSLYFGELEFRHGLLRTKTKAGKASGVRAAPRYNGLRKDFAREGCDAPSTTRLSHGAWPLRPVDEGLIKRANCCVRYIVLEPQKGRLQPFKAFTVPASPWDSLRKQRNDVGCSVLLFQS